LTQRALLGSISAQEELEVMENELEAIARWNDLESMRKQQEILELVSPKCSQKFPLVCWDCRQGCPPETCFKCVDNIDQKICCYGTGGKVLTVVGLEDDIPDC
ncbi:MAG: hypothetical protein ACRC80_24695, partial [Waterburya sp.]